MTSPRLPQWVAIAVTFVLAIAVVWIGTPRPPNVSGHSSGDPVLADRLRTLASDPGHQAVAATAVTSGSVTHAAIGEITPGSATTIQPDDPIVAGSIVKTFDGFLLADAAARGEVGLDDPVGLYLPELAGTQLGQVTLTELASHRGGVPPLTPSTALQTIPTVLGGANPYGEASRESMLREIRHIEPLDKLQEADDGIQYSNLGATLLGWALAEAANSPDWETYVRERLLTPAGITATFAAHPEELPQRTVPGFTTNGFEPEPWTGLGYQPAGVGAYMAPEAMATYAQAILREEVPGASAMDPQFAAGPDTEIGLAWFTTTSPDGRSITWHNGRTNGFSTILAIDRAAGRAVFAVGNTDEAVENLGFALLTGDAIPPRGFDPSTLIIPAITAFVVVLWLWSAFRARNRIAAVSACAAAVGILALARPLGSWIDIPPAVWAGLALVTAAGAVAAIARWPAVPWQANRFRVPRAAFAGLNILVAGAAVVFTAIWR